MIVEVERLPQRDEALLSWREHITPTLRRGSCYGVIFFRRMGSHPERLDVASLTFFGEAAQLDQSPCGTGTTSLAELLTARGLRAPRLRNYSRHGAWFEVSRRVQERGALQQPRRWWLRCSDDFEVKVHTLAHHLLAPRQGWRVTPVCRLDR